MTEVPVPDYRYNPIPSPKPDPGSIPSVEMFRSWFPEFKDVNVYSDFQVEFYLIWASDLMGDRLTQAPEYDYSGAVYRWGKMFDRYVALLAAHCLALAAQAQKVAAAGGIPGTQTGIIDHKTAGPLSIGYNTTLGIAKNAGWFASTKYGNQWYEQMVLVGAGGLTV